MNTQVLATEVALPAYVGQAEWEIADALNAATVPAKVKVATWQARGLLSTTAEWGMLDCISRGLIPLTDFPEEHRRSILVTVSNAVLVIGGTTELDTDQPTVMAAVSQMLQALAFFGLISAETHEGLLAMTDGFVSRAHQLGLGTVSAADVGAAINLNRESPHA